AHARHAHKLGCGAHTRRVGSTLMRRTWSDPPAFATPLISLTPRSPLLSRSPLPSEDAGRSVSRSSAQAHGGAGRSDVVELHGVGSWGTWDSPRVKACPPESSA